MACTVGVLVLAGFVQGLTGFGFGMVVMGLLPPLIGIEQALAVATLAGLATTLANTGLTLRHLHWSSTGALWFGTVVGVPLGFEALSAVPQAVVMRLLGLALCALILFDLSSGRKDASHWPTWAGWCTGLVSGTLSGAFNMGGPPLVAYVYGRPWSKERQVATLSGLFLTGGVIRLVLLMVRGEVAESSWASAAWAIGPLLVAVVCGHRLLRFVPQNRLRVAVQLFLLALGARYLLAGV
jgi:uncharacterized membrane protein YfcA